MPEEFLDIYDEHGQPTGASQFKKQAHAQGLWHRVVHVWLCNSAGELLIQLRSPQKDNCPNMWDISAAGHISAGENDTLGAWRETKEELGLDLNPKQLSYLGETQKESIKPNYIDREFASIFLVRLDLDSSVLQLQESEVSAVKWIAWPELKKTVESGDPTFVPHPAEYELLFKYLADHQN